LFSGLWFRERGLIIINLSVWEDLASLRAFVFRGAHAGFLKRRREWFDVLTDAYVAMWWVPAAHRPTLAGATAQIEHLKQHGPSPEVFAFRECYPAPDAAAGEGVVATDDASAV
jgi:hypothetical protein